MNNFVPPRVFSHSRFAHFAPLLALLLIFWAISLSNLTIVPRVYEDEPWQASTGWKLATDGVFGSDVFAGFAGAEHNYYGFMPLHPILLAMLYRAAGLGLFQTRLETVVLGLLTLALTSSLARRLFRDARIGWLAVLFLISARTAGLTPYQLTGILFLDMARISRYDMLVPVLGLASLHAYLCARRTGRGWWYGLTGLLAGLAGLAHLYGLFWLPVLVVLLGADALSRRNTPSGQATEWRALVVPLAAVVVGFTLPWLLYLGYVLSDVSDWRAQTLVYAVRFDLLNPTWYVTNVLSEYHRYGPGLEMSVPGLLGRVGFWSAAVSVPLALAVLAYRAWKGDWRARVIVVPALLLPVLFALLLLLKLVNYTLIIVPFFAIAAAWGVVGLWSQWPTVSYGRWLRVVLVVLLLGVVAEGGLRVVVLEQAAQMTTPYARLIAQVRSFLPAKARVLGYHTFWMGLEDFDYRSLFVPLLWTDPQNTPRPYALDEGLTRVLPDIVLVNQRLLDYFNDDNAQAAENGARFQKWMSEHHAEAIGRIDDLTYGLIEIYRIRD